MHDWCLISGIAFLVIAIYELYCYIKLWGYTGALELQTNKKNEEIKVLCSKIASKKSDNAKLCVQIETLKLSLQKLLWCEEYAKQLEMENSKLKQAQSRKRAKQRCIRTEKSQKNALSVKAVA
jgi:cell shape-determining protein MreC